MTSIEVIDCLLAIAISPVLAIVGLPSFCLLESFGIFWDVFEIQIIMLPSLLTCSKTKDVRHDSGCIASVTGVMIHESCQSGVS